MQSFQAWPAMQAKHKISFCMSIVGLGGPECKCAAKRPKSSLLAPALQQQCNHAANVHMGSFLLYQDYICAPWTSLQKVAGKFGGPVPRWPSAQLGSVCVGQDQRHRLPSVLRTQSVQTQLLGHQGSLKRDYGANDITPDNIVAQSNHPVGWVCAVYGHNACCLFYLPPWTGMLIVES